MAVFLAGSTVVGDDDKTQHKGALVWLGNAASTTAAPQLKAMCQELGWVDAGSLSALQYADLARVTACTLSPHAAADGKPWLKNMVKPRKLSAAGQKTMGSLENTARPFGSLLEDMEQAYALLTAADTAIGALDDNSFIELEYSDTAPPAWQKKITYGMLGRSEIGFKTLAWLEYYAWERADKDEHGRATSVLDKLDVLARGLGLTPLGASDDQRALGAVAALAGYAYLDHAATRYRPFGPERAVQLSEEVLAARAPVMLGDSRGVDESHTQNPYHNPRRLTFDPSAAGSYTVTPRCLNQRVYPRS